MTLSIQGWRRKKESTWLKDRCGTGVSNARVLKKKCGKGSSIKNIESFIELNETDREVFHKENSAQNNAKNYEWKSAYSPLSSFLLGILSH